MKTGLNTGYRRAIFCIFLMVLVGVGSCEKEQKCMTCYRVGTNGIIPETATKMCGDDGIEHLLSRGYLCRDE